MPTYTYRCQNCQHVFEVFATAQAEEFCPECESLKTVRIISPVPAHYKGTGFYSTDYKKKD